MSGRRLWACIVLWQAVVLGGSAAAETISYHSGRLGGTSYTASNYSRAVYFDLPDPTKTYEVVSIGISSQADEATFPAGSEVVIRIWDSAGVPIYTSDVFDWSGQDGSPALRVHFIDYDHVQVSGSFYGGFQQIGEPFTFGYHFDYPYGASYDRSYYYNPCKVFSGCEN